MAAVAFAIPSKLLAQAPAPGGLLSLAGTWTPVNAEDSDWFFSHGMSAISGGTNLTIDPQSGQVTITIVVPDDKLDKLLNILEGARFYTSLTYRVRSGRSGGTGAAGPPRAFTPMWLDDCLVIPDSGVAGGQTVTYFRSGDLLQVESATTIPSGHINTARQLLAKAR